MLRQLMQKPYPHAYCLAMKLCSVLTCVIRYRCMVGAVGLFGKCFGNSSYTLWRCEPSQACMLFMTSTSLSCHALFRTMLCMHMHLVLLGWRSWCQL